MICSHFEPLTRVDGSEWGRVTCRICADFRARISAAEAGRDAANATCAKLQGFNHELAEQLATVTAERDAIRSAGSGPHDKSPYEVGFEDATAAWKARLADVTAERDSLERKLTASQKCTDEQAEEIEAMRPVVEAARALRVAATTLNEETWKPYNEAERELFRRLDAIDATTEVHGSTQTFEPGPSKAGGYSAAELAECDCEKWRNLDAENASLRDDIEHLREKLAEMTRRAEARLCKRHGTRLKDFDRCWDCDVEELGVRRERLATVTAERNEYRRLNHWQSDEIIRLRLELAKANDVIEAVRAYHRAYTGEGPEESTSDMQRAMFVALRVLDAAPEGDGIGCAHRFCSAAVEQPGGFCPRHAPPSSSVIEPSGAINEKAKVGADGKVGGTYPEPYCNGESGHDVARRPHGLRAAATPAESKLHSKLNTILDDAKATIAAVNAGRIEKTRIAYEGGRAYETQCTCPAGYNQRMPSGPARDPACPEHGASRPGQCKSSPEQHPAVAMANEAPGSKETGLSIDEWTDERCDFWFNTFNRGEHAASMLRGLKAKNASLRAAHAEIAALKAQLVDVAERQRSSDRLHCRADAWMQNWPLVTDSAKETKSCDSSA